jgi:hypothetical protein
MMVLTYRRNILLRNIGIVVVIAFGLIATFFGYQARMDRNQAERTTVAARASAAEALRQKQAADKSASLSSSPNRANLS